MEKIVVKGGVPLNGTVEISGMKNAALPIIFACVLVKDKCYIENVPNVRDVSFALDILRSLGASIKTINTIKIIPRSVMSDVNRNLPKPYSWIVMAPTHNRNRL